MALYTLEEAPGLFSRPPMPAEVRASFSAPIDEAGQPMPARPEPQLETMYLPVVHDPFRNQLEDSVNFPHDVGTAIAQRYEVTSRLGSGSFSHAVQCKEAASGKSVCIKIVRNNKDFVDQSLGEIKILQYLNQLDGGDEHHILRLEDYFYYKEHLFLVTELLRDNLYVLYRYVESYFTLPRIRSIARQTLRALAFLHRHSVYHCDLKPENILLSSFSRCQVKVIDFGSSCFATDSHSSYVQSRSYRAPEVVLGVPYNAKIDVWSLGCVLAELSARRVLFVHDSVGKRASHRAACASPSATPHSARPAAG